MEPIERDYLDGLYREMRGKLLQYAYANLSSVGQAEDAVQETFMVASAKIQNVMESENPCGWLINALKLILREMNRRSAKDKQHVAISFSDIESQDITESPASIQSELRIMELLYSGLVSREDYELLKTVYIHGFSIQEAAQRLGISNEACKKRIQRARAKMKKALEETEKPS